MESEFLVYKYKSKHFSFHVAAGLCNAAFFLWQLHEASLFALGSLSEQLCEAQVGFTLFFCSAEQFINSTIFLLVFGARSYSFW